MTDTEDDEEPARSAFESNLRKGKKALKDSNERIAQKKAPAAPEEPIDVVLNWGKPFHKISEDRRQDVLNDRLCMLVFSKGDVAQTVRDMKILFQYGADPNMLAHNQLPLLHALLAEQISSYSHTDAKHFTDEKNPILQCLLEHGADPNIITDSHQISALAFASTVAQAALLIKNGANIHQTIQNGDFTVVQFLAYRGLEDVVNLLITEGASNPRPVVNAYYTGLLRFSSEEKGLGLNINSAAKTLDTLLSGAEQLLEKKTGLREEVMQATKREIEISRQTLATYTQETKLAHGKMNQTLISNLRNLKEGAPPYMVGVLMPQHACYLLVTRKDVGKKTEHYHIQMVDRGGLGTWHPKHPKKLGVLAIDVSPADLPKVTNIIKEIEGLKNFDEVAPKVFGTSNNKERKTLFGFPFHFVEGLAFKPFKQGVCVFANLKTAVSLAAQEVVQQEKHTPEVAKQAGKVNAVRLAAQKFEQQENNTPEVATQPSKQQKKYTPEIAKEASKVMTTLLREVSLIELSKTPEATDYAKKAAKLFDKKRHHYGEQPDALRTSAITTQSSYVKLFGETFARQFPWMGFIDMLTQHTWEYLWPAKEQPRAPNHVPNKDPSPTIEVTSTTRSTTPQDPSKEIRHR